MPATGRDAARQVHLPLARRSCTVAEVEVAERGRMQGSVTFAADRCASSSENPVHRALLRGSATVGHSLTAGLFDRITGSVEKSASFSWQKRVGESWVDIHGPTGDRIDIGPDLLGQQVRALATAPSITDPEPIASDGVTVGACNPIVIENRNAGTKDWMIADLATNREIEGYADATSINAGGSLGIMVSLSAEGAFDLQVYRLGYYGGLGGRLMFSAPGLRGTTQSDPVMTNAETRLVECRWDESYRLKTSPEWTSGLYLIKLTARMGGKQSLVPFVLRKDNRPSDLGFQDAVTTAQAYNVFGGYSVYDDSSVNGTRAHQVSFDRPYDATCLGFGNTDGFDCNNMLSWEYNMVRWLESQGYDVSYYTSIDVHRTPLQVLSQRVFLSVGHDEYWSMEQRDRVEAARDNGINLAFFSANSAYWRVRYDPSSAGTSDRVVTIYKDSTGIGAGASIDPVARSDPGASTSLFRSEEVGRPENALLGVGYVSDHWNIHEGFDFIVSNASDPIYAHTGLRNGDRLKGLVGYEWDGVLDNGMSPDGMVILSRSPTRANPVQPPLPGGTRPTMSHSVRYRAPSGAQVFSTGSIQWVWGLDDSRVCPPPQLSRSLLGRARSRVKGWLSSAFGRPGTSVPRADRRAQQVAVNLFREMGARPQTPSSWLVLS